MEYDCPRDSHALVRNSDSEATGTQWRCNTCSGAMFTELLSTEVASKNLAIGPREPWDNRISCPRDGTQMHKVAAASVAIDHCMKCGAAWLDGEELERLFMTPEAAHAKAQPGMWSEGDWFTPVVFAVIEALFNGH